jgi:hypothetical protein
MAPATSGVSAVSRFDEARQRDKRSDQVGLSGYPDLLEHRTQLFADGVQADASFSRDLLGRAALGNGRCDGGIG